MPPIYLDNAASTRVSDDVLALMTDVMKTAWGNPSAQHPQGATARGHIDTAKTRMLAALGDRAGKGDVVWTSGCSESNALAVRLAQEGREIRRIAPGRDGVLDPDEVREAAKGAGVVSLIMVQNEIGV